MKFEIVFKYNLGRIRTVVLFGIVSLLSISCSKIDDIKSERLATEETNWKTLEDARANLMSVYGLMRSASISDNGHWLMGDLRQGDFKITNRADLKAIVNEQLNASHTTINRLTNWRRFYAAINAASLFIERSSEILEHDRRYTEVNNEADIAQARIVRAFAYFYMVRIWGDVPLFTSSNDGNFIEQGRTSKERVLAFCTNELLEAAKVVPFHYGGEDPILPGLYYGEGWASWNGSIFTRLSAYIVLAHISAWQSNYVDAINYAKFVLDNRHLTNGGGSYGVSYLDMAALTENEVSYSPFAYKRATVLVGFPSETGNGLATANGHIEQLTLASPFIPKGTPEMFVSKDTILKVFTDPKDLRFSKDLVTNKFRTNYFYGFETERPIFNKIKVIYGAATSGDMTLYASSMVFSRLEEITLLLAESYAALGDDNNALIYLNQACEKRGIIYTKVDNPDLIKAVFEERRKELMGEGWRWYDIVREQRLKKLNTTYTIKNGQPLTFKEFEAAGGIYWPISQDVIDANKQIKQNPYWEY